MSCSIKILAIDDDPNILAILETTLKGYSVLLAETGGRALEILKLFRPDVILLDITLPDFDGYKLCELIRASAIHKFTKIIMISGKHLLEDRLKAYASYADDYITKPFDALELRAKVEIFSRFKHSQEVDAIKSDVLSLFHHETRTPLMGIIGISELLLSEPQKLDHEICDALKLIISQGNRLLDFVEKGSLLCELKSGFHRNFELVPVIPVIRAVISGFDEKINRRSIQIQEDWIFDLQIYADIKLLEKIFSYILDNAIRFSLDGGLIRVSVAADSSGKIWISVADDGPGIDPDWLPLIFDEFAIRDLKHHQKGQGLSLAIVRHVMNLHGGNVFAESEPGKGCKMVMVFPSALI